VPAPLPCEAGIVGDDREMGRDTGCLLYTVGKLPLGLNSLEVDTVDAKLPESSLRRALLPSKDVSSPPLAVGNKTRPLRPEPPPRGRYDGISRVSLSLIFVARTGDGEVARYRRELAASVSLGG